MLKSPALLPILAVLLLCNLLLTYVQVGGGQTATRVIASDEIPTAAAIAGFLPDIIAPAVAAETETSQQQPQDQQSQKSTGRRSLATAAVLVFIGFMLGLLAAYAYHKYLVPRESEEIFPETSNPNPEQAEPAKTVQPPLVSVPVQAKPEKQVADDMEILSLRGQPFVDINRGFLVDEIDSVVEEAKFFVAIGRAQQAIDLLVDHIDTNRETSAESWIYLMDLYRNLGNKAEFDALAVRFKHVFNVVEPQWDSELVDLSIPVSLVEFPHIENKLVALWGTSECVNFLTELTSDNREGTRAGFSMEVFSEILLLIAIAEMRDDMPGHKV
jgi:hypothetical protein